MKKKTQALSLRHVIVMALAGAVPLAIFATYKIVKHGEIETSGIFGMTMGGLAVIGTIIMTARERKKEEDEHSWELTAVQLNRSSNKSELVNPIYAAGNPRITSNPKPTGWGASPHRWLKNEIYRPHIVSRPWMHSDGSHRKRRNE